MGQNSSQMQPAHEAPDATTQPDHAVSEKEPEVKANPVIKPTKKPVTKPAPKSVTKPATKPTKPATKPTTKPATEPTKITTKPAAQSATKPAPKPAPKLATRPPIPPPKATGTLPKLKRKRGSDASEPQRKRSKLAQVQAATNALHSKLDLPEDDVEQNNDSAIQKPVGKSKAKSTPRAAAKKPNTRQDDEQDTQEDEMEVDSGEPKGNAKSPKKRANKKKPVLDEPFEIPETQESANSRRKSSQQQAPKATTRPQGYVSVPYKRPRPRREEVRKPAAQHTQNAAAEPVIQDSQPDGHVSKWLKGQDIPLGSPNKPTPHRRLPKDAEEDQYDYENVQSPRTLPDLSPKARAARLEALAKRGRTADRWLSIPDGPSKGAFTKDEKDMADDVFKATCEEENITPDELKILISDWQSMKCFKEGIFIALPNRNNQSVRRFCQRRFELGTTGKWTEDEDDILQEKYQETPNEWVQIAAHVGRSSEACRDRWRGHLKHKGTVELGPWTMEEEDKLVNAVNEAIETMKKSSNDEGFRNDRSRLEEAVSWKVVVEKLECRRTEKRCREKFGKLRRRGLLGPDGERVQQSTQPPPSQMPGPKRLREVKNDFEQFKIGDIYDVLKEIGEAVGKHQTYQDDTTLWSIVSSKNPDSRFSGGLRRLAYKYAISEFRTKRVGKAVGIAEKARAIITKIDKGVEEGNIVLMHGYAGTPKKVKQPRIAKTEEEKAADEDRRGIQKQKREERAKFDAAQRQRRNDEARSGATKTASNRKVSNKKGAKSSEFVMDSDDEGDDQATQEAAPQVNDDEAVPGANNEQSEPETESESEPEPQSDHVPQPPPQSPPAADPRQFPMTPPTEEFWASDQEFPTAITPASEDYHPPAPAPPAPEPAPAPSNTQAVDPTLQSRPQLTEIWAFDEPFTDDSSEEEESSSSEESSSEESSSGESSSDEEPWVPDPNAYPIVTVPFEKSSSKDSSSDEEAEAPTPDAKPIVTARALPEPEPIVPTRAQPDAKPFFPVDEDDSSSSDSSSDEDEPDAKPVVQAQASAAAQAQAKAKKANANPLAERTVPVKPEPQSGSDASSTDPSSDEDSDSSDDNSSDDTSRFDKDSIASEEPDADLSTGDFVKRCEKAKASTLKEKKSASKKRQKQKA